MTMPDFRIYLRQMTASIPSELGIECPDLEQAYLEVCAAIPEMAHDMLVAGRNPMTCVVDIHDKEGRLLMQVPFAEVLPSPASRIRRARRQPQDGGGADRAREDRAVSSFRQMFGGLPVSCRLLSLDLRFVEINAACVRSGNTGADSVRGKFILDVYGDVTEDLRSQSRKFFALAQAGAVSEIVDFPYPMVDEEGRMTKGWWSGRVWPIYDDDDKMVGLVNWAESSLRPKADGITIVRIASASTR